MSRYSPPPFSLAIQLANLQGQNPHGHGHVQRAKLTWQFHAQPTPVSRSYRMRLDYTLRGAPEMFVVAPKLQALAAERRIPHLYEQKRGRLCLYLPKTGEWHDRRLLADTIVPWSVLWLFYFEEWLVSGEWKGGGVHIDTY
jgi:hypothetical protein